MNHRYVLDITDTHLSLSEKTENQETPLIFIQYSEHSQRKTAIKFLSKWLRKFIGYRIDG